MKEKVVFLQENESYITLQSLLKVVGAIQTGGMAKFFLQENDVYVNNERETRRGRKLYCGDVVSFPGGAYLIEKHDN